MVILETPVQKVLLAKMELATQKELPVQKASLECLEWLEMKDPQEIEEMMHRLVINKY